MDRFTKNRIALLKAQRDQLQSVVSYHKTNRTDENLDQYNAMIKTLCERIKELQDQ